MKLLVLCNDRLAIPALHQLLHMKIVAGVGMTARESEVHLIVQSLCKNYGVPLMAFRKETFANDLRQWVEKEMPDAVLVKTFPWKIPAECLPLPRFGFINFHYAPLPEFRGPNPLFWMIRDGVKETGVTVHRMTESVDDGPVILRSSIPIAPEATFGMLVSQLGMDGLELTGKLLQAVMSGKTDGEVQDGTYAKWYPRPAQEDLWVNWKSMDAENIRRLANACNPWNKGAPAKILNRMIGITHATPLPQTSDALPGTILGIDEKRGLQVCCMNGSVLKIDVFFTEEGFLPGHSLAGFGVNAGHTFT